MIRLSIPAIVSLFLSISLLWTLVADERSVRKLSEKFPKQNENLGAQLQTSFQAADDLHLPKESSGSSDLLEISKVPIQSILSGSARSTSPSPVFWRGHAIPSVSPVSAKEPSMHPRESQQSTYDEDLVEPLTIEPTEDYAGRSPKEIQDLLLREAQSKLNVTLWRAKRGIRPPSMMKSDFKVAYVISFGNKHVLVAMETLLAYRQAKQVYSNQTLPQLIAVTSDLSPCAKDIVATIVSDIVLVRSDWPAMDDDEYFLKFEVFTNPIFREYDSVVASDIDRLLNPSLFAHMGVGEALHLTDDPIHIELRPQYEVPNFYFKRFSEEQKRAFREMAFADYLSVQSNAFELKPKSPHFPSIEDMDKRIRSLLMAFPSRVVNKHDQGLIPYLFGPHQLSPSYLGFPRCTTHVGGKWAMDVFSDVNNWNCANTSFMEIREFFTNRSVRALELYISQTHSRNTECVRKAENAIQCLSRAWSLLEKCRERNYLAPESQLVHSIHARCIQAFGEEPILSFDDVVANVKRDILHWYITKKQRRFRMLQENGYFQGREAPLVDIFGLQVGL